MAPGYFELVDWLKARGKKVFVDVKLFDVPATVAAAVRRLCARDIDFITVHGNQQVMEAAAEARSGDSRILAVTALTSLDQGDLDDMGFACDIESLVLSRAKRALEAGWACLSARATPPNCAPPSRSRAAGASASAGTRP